jgi:hypothetical protein
MDRRKRSLTGAVSLSANALGVVVLAASCSPGGDNQGKRPDDGNTGTAIVTPTPDPGGTGTPSATETELIAENTVGAVTIRDLALVTGFQNIVGGQLQRARAVIAADFDNDGRVDFYRGNPGGISYVARNGPGADGLPHFTKVQTLETLELAWGAAPLDYDNDGDTDIFITNGGNEGIGLARLYRNEWVETGTLTFTDVTDEAGVAGPIPPGFDAPIPVAGGNATIVDFDRDGDEDIFESVNIMTDNAFSVDACSLLAGDPSLEAWKGRQLLWVNQGDGTFVDGTDAAGLGRFWLAARNSSFLDIDGDGDFDLFMNNVQSHNEIMLNQLVETGSAHFINGMDEMRRRGVDLSYPIKAVSSAPDDFNQDGQMDLLVFSKGSLPEPGPYPEGHALFVGGPNGWGNVAESSGLLEDIDLRVPGVMGSQTGDVNLDGRPDVYAGNGGVDKGTIDSLFLSEGEAGDPVTFVNGTILTDFPAPEQPGISYPTYPYRTHGTVVVDVDDNGTNELAVSEGGPAVSIGAEEPSRLFAFDFGMPQPPYVKIRLEGDGVTVPVDAIGSRVAVHTTGATDRVQYQTIAVGHGFSAHVLYDLNFPLPGAKAVDSIEVRWTDGVTERFEDPVAFGDHLLITRGAGIELDPRF